MKVQIMENWIGALAVGGRRRSGPFSLRYANGNKSMAFVVASGAGQPEGVPQQSPLSKK